MNNNFPLTVAPWAISSGDKKSTTQSEFKSARKLIRNEADIQMWKKSLAFHNITNFINTLTRIIQSKPLDCSYHISVSCEKIHHYLEKLDEWVQEIPPITQPMRFGNKAFRTWYNKLNSQAIYIHHDLGVNDGEIDEIIPYFLSSFGDNQRIDYGTGHELNFICWLFILEKMDILSKDDYLCLIFYIFNRYLTTVRLLQSTYYLEPAGSKGVWGLDDYQFLPFLWGASQLINHHYITPSSILNAEILKSDSHQYLYLQAIQFIQKMKSGAHFSEYAPYLYDLSGMSDWTMVAKCLYKMYINEVFLKFPVVQHFLFGKYLQFETKKTKQPIPKFNDTS